MAFDGFRENGFPTYYAENKTPWEADILTSGLIFAFVILAFSLYIILPGFKGLEKVYLFIRITVSLFIGGVILVTIFTQTWETAETTTRTKYKAGIGQDVNVTVGVHIGLKGINITLKGDGEQLPGEIINYNEHFSWDSPQGRLGFGPYAGVFNQEYRAAQLRGLPLPILWVAEYFTIDGEGIRWGRIYRQAGFYAHIMLWLSFPLWILSNILFFVLLRFGAYMLTLTGLCMLTSNIVWGCYRNYVELAIPFTAHDVLEFSFGGSFWVVLATGILCVVIGVLVFILDKRFPTQIAHFFGVDVLQDWESLIEEEDIDEEVPQPPTGASEEDKNQESSDDEDELYFMPEPSQPPPGRGSGPMTDRAKAYAVKVPSVKGTWFRSSENRLTARLQRPRRRENPHTSKALLSAKLSVPSAAVPEEEAEDGSLYQNMPDVPARRGLNERHHGNGDNGTVEMKNFTQH